jgi:hypothetical protein
MRLDSTLHQPPDHQPVYGASFSTVFLTCATWPPEQLIFPAGIG